MAGPLLDGRGGLLPLEAVWDRDAIQLVAAGHAQEGCFSLPSAQAVLRLPWGGPVGCWQTARLWVSQNVPGLPDETTTVLSWALPRRLLALGVLCPVRGDLGHRAWATLVPSLLFDVDDQLAGESEGLLGLGPK